MRPRTPRPPAGRSTSRPRRRPGRCAGARCWWEGHARGRGLALLSPEAILAESAIIRAFCWTEQAKNQSRGQTWRPPHPPERGSAMNDVNTDEQNKLKQLLDITPSAGGARARWRRRVVAGLALALGIGLFLLARHDTGPAVRYLTEPATRGELVVTAIATGTLQPIKSVDVGSELSGTVASVLAGENDAVKRGQLLAELDTSRLQDAVIRSEAMVRAAEGQVATTRAT